MRPMTTLLVVLFLTPAISHADVITFEPLGQCINGEVTSFLASFSGNATSPRNIWICDQPTDLPFCDRLASGITGQYNVCDLVRPTDVGRHYVIERPQSTVSKRIPATLGCGPGDSFIRRMEDFVLSTGATILRPPEQP